MEIFGNGWLYKSRRNRLSFIDGLAVGGGLAALFHSVVPTRRLQSLPSEVINSQFPNG